MTTDRSDRDQRQAGDGSPGVPEGDEREAGTRDEPQTAGDRTGTGRRAAEAAGESSDENNRADAERALRESRGE